MKYQNAFCLSVKGQRKVNQDACFVYQEGNLTFIGVADGMGGAHGGEIASQEVVEVCRVNIIEAARDNHSPEDLKNILGKVFRDAQERLGEIVQESPELSGMGTTLSCVLMKDKHYVWGNIGDSRVYLIREGKLRQITRDHSLVEEYRQQHGKDIPSFIKQQRNVITRVIGINQDEADVFPKANDYETLNEDEGFLICSDGLLPESLEQDATWMANYVIGTKTLKAAAQHMICHAYHHGSTDNISIVLYEYRSIKRKKTRIKKYRFPPDKNKIVATRAKASSRINQKPAKFVLGAAIIMLIGLSLYVMKDVDISLQWPFSGTEMEIVSLMEKGEQLIDTTGNQMKQTIISDYCPFIKGTENTQSYSSEGDFFWNAYDGEGVSYYRVLFLHNNDTISIKLNEISLSFKDYPNLISGRDYKVSVTVVLEDKEIEGCSKKIIKLTQN